MPQFEFQVKDDGGLWGALRLEAGNAIEAEEMARGFLDTTEVAPRGSLAPDYTLVLVAGEPGGGETPKGVLRNAGIGGTMTE